MFFFTNLQFYIKIPLFIVQLIVLAISNFTVYSYECSFAHCYFAACHFSVCQLVECLYAYVILVSLAILRVKICYLKANKNDFLLMFLLTLGTIHLKMSLWCFCNVLP